MKISYVIRIVFCRSGLTAYIALLPAGSDLAGARGDTLLPYPVSTLFQHLVLDADKFRRDFDKQLDKFTILEELSPQHRIEHTQYKGVFPTDPRDFVIFTGWEATPDGGFLIYTTSVVREDLPEAKRYVRGSLDIGGWIVRPVSAKELAEAQASGLGPTGASFKDSSEACRVSRLFRTSIGGGVPVVLVRSATAAQAQVPLVLHKMLEQRITKEGPFCAIHVNNIAVSPPTINVIEHLPPVEPQLLSSLDARDRNSVELVTTADMDLALVPAPVAEVVDTVHNALLSDSVGAAVPQLPEKKSSTILQGFMSSDSAVDLGKVDSSFTPLSESAFVVPPTLPEPYEKLRSDTMKKMNTLFEDSLLSDKPSYWKLAGQST